MNFDKRLLNDHRMPGGPPSGWNCVDEVRGHYLAREFAREFLVDWDPVATMHRLEYYQDDAKVRGLELRKHPLVSQYLADFMRDLTRTEGISEDNIVALLWREAHDFSFSATSRSRVAALKTLIDFRTQLCLNGSSTSSEDDQEDEAPAGLTITINKT